MLINMTLYLSITALIILLIKHIFKNKMPKKMQLYIWSILLVRFFVPRLPESKISVYNVIPEGVNDISTGMLLPVVQNAANIEINHNIDYIFWGWLIISLLLLIYFLAVYISFSLKTRKMSVITSEKTVNSLNTIKEILGINRKIKVVSGGNTPILKGFFKPVIVLPDIYNQDEIKDVFCHELCHLKYGDIFIIWFSTLILCFNWFNPIMWFAFFTIRRDIEFACDERVLNYTNNHKEYAKLLIKTSLGKNRFILGTTALQNGEKEISKRIKFIAGFKKPKVYVSLILAVVILIVSGVCLTNAINKTKQTELYDLRIQYVGDASKVSKIVNALPDLESTGIELHTDNPPYGLTVHSKEYIEDGDFVLSKSADLLFLMIDNLDEVTLNMGGTEYKYTRLEENLRFPKPIREYSKSRDEFYYFVSMVESSVNTIDKKDSQVMEYDYSETVLITDKIVDKVRIHPIYNRMKPDSINISDYLGKKITISVLGDSVHIYDGGEIIFMFDYPEYEEDLIDEVKALFIEAF